MSVAVPELADNVQLHIARLGQRIGVIFCVDFVRLRESPLVVETIKPIFWHACDPRRPANRMVPRAL